MMTTTRLCGWFVVLSLVINKSNLAFSQSQQDRSVLSSAIKKLENKKGDERFDTATSLFLDKKFISNPTGEGSLGAYDQRPLWRLDGFDCSTFVETITALYLLSANQEYDEVLKSVRYKDGDVRFESRLHFPDLDWDNHLIENGYADDISRAVAGNLAQRYQYQVTRRRWYEHLSEDRIFLSDEQSKDKKQSTLQALRSLGRSVPEFETVEFDYIPIEAIFAPVQSKKMFFEGPIVSLRDYYFWKLTAKRFRLNTELINRIPSRVIFGLIKPGQIDPVKEGTTVAMSHRGFIVRTKSNELVWRHMTLQFEKSVEVNFVREMLHRIQNPALLGLRLLQLRE